MKAITLSFIAFLIFQFIHSQNPQPQFSICSGVGYALLNSQTPDQSISSLYSMGIDGSLTLIGGTGTNNLNGLGTDNRTGKNIYGHCRVHFLLDLQFQLQ